MDNIQIQNKLLLAGSSLTDNKSRSRIYVLDQNITLDTIRLNEFVRLNKVESWKINKINHRPAQHPKNWIEVEFIVWIP